MSGSISALVINFDGLALSRSTQGLEDEGGVLFRVSPACRTVFRGSELRASRAEVSESRHILLPNDLCMSLTDDVDASAERPNLSWSAEKDRISAA
jgi:hypothetical protein